MIRADRKGKMIPNNRPIIAGEGEFSDFPVKENIELFWRDITRSTKLCRSDKGGTIKSECSKTKRHVRVWNLTMSENFEMLCGHSGGWYYPEQEHHNDYSSNSPFLKFYYAINRTIMIIIILLPIINYMLNKDIWRSSWTKLRTLKSLN